MRRGIVAFAILLLSACGGEAETKVPELTEEYGCGFGFYVGEVDQTSGLFVTYIDFEAASAGHVSPSSLIETAWDGQLQLGSDLFANWCDDVLEPDEPTPEITETWELTGQVDIVRLPDVGQCGEAVAELTELVAHGPDDSTIELDDLTITNEAWGCFAG